MSSSLRRAAGRPRDPNNDVWRIDDRLWLGDYQSGCEALAGARRPDASQDPTPFFGVVSLCPMPLFPTDQVTGPAENATEWLKLPIMDGGNGESEFEHALGVALPFVNRRRQLGNVLVHCAAGMSRSVSVIAAILCGQDAIAPDVAFERVADAKSAALGPFIDRDLLICPAKEFKTALSKRFSDRDGRPGGT